MEACSIWEASMFEGESDKALWRARLLASVAPLVNTTSSGKAPKRWAISSRESSSAFLAFRPAPWLLDGFPNWVKAKGRMASQISGKTGVVAFASR